MKAYTKIALLVALALFLTLAACTRQASKPPVAAPTATGEVPFPFTTAGAGGISNFGTQTAIAKTPQVVIATNTPEVVGQTNTTEGQPAAGTGGTGAEVNTGGGEAGSSSEAGGGVQQPQAPAAPAVAVNTPVISRPGTYTLQRGEWPICIARRYDLDLGTFFAQNGLNMNSKPSAGAVLTIPSGGSWSSAYGGRSLKAHPGSYTVKAGDTVYTIACQYGDVAPESILAVNGLGNASDVKAGMSLSIP